MRYFQLKGLSFAIGKNSVMITTPTERFMYDVDPRHFHIYTHWGRRMCNAELVAIKRAGYKVWS
ncbi:MAG: hypothetical protein ACXABY_14430 [Candidatus Thorarchaeota archaeon]|jgi:hypothetical protein